MIKLSNRSDTYVITSNNVGQIAVSDDEKLAIEFIKQTNRALDLAGVRNGENELFYKLVPTVEDDSPMEWLPSQIDLINVINRLSDKIISGGKVDLFPDGGDHLGRVVSWCHDKRER